MPNQKEIQFVRWLQALLADEQYRAVLRELVQQNELPVIEIEQAS